MTDIKITMSGDEKVDRLFADMQTRSENFVPLLELFEREQALGEADIFGSEGAIVGGWAPLSPRYLLWKTAHYGPKPIMVRTGNLMESLTGAPMRVSRITPKEAILGTDVRYAHFHQDGTRKMPKRKIVEVIPGMSRLWADQAGRYVVKGE